MEEECSDVDPDGVEDENESDTPIKKGSLAESPKPGRIAGNLIMDLCLCFLFIGWRSVVS